MGVPASARRGSCTRPLVLPLALLAAFAAATPASAQILFGPKQYTLTTTTPQTFSAFVSTTAGAAHLHVVNGAADGSARLTHASISVNGVEVVGPEDLGADVALVDKPVLLFSNNVLTLTLSGPVGGTLEVTLERRSASLTSVTPSSGRQGETVSVAIVGSNTHFAQGTTLLWAGRGISVGGAPPGTFGPVTVQDGTHLTATLTIGPSIVLGPRLLLAKTNGERAALFPGVTVLAGTPAIAGTTVTTLAGTGTPGLVDGAGSTAQFRFPADVAPRADGSAIVADTANSRLRALAPDGTTTTVSLPVSLLLPTGVTLDPTGRTVIADTARCVIRIVNPDGTVTTIGSAFSCTFANGPPGTARFRFPRDVVADAAGNLYVADAGNFRVRKIDPQGTVTTLAGTGTFGGADGPATSATFGLLTGIAVAEEPAGPPAVLVSDAVFHRLRQIAPDGTVTTVAGTGIPGFADGPAAAAQVAFPTRLTRDSAGNLYLADTLNNLIRRLTPQGTVETVAGTGAWGSQDGPGTSATFTLPVGVGLAPAAPSTVFVADTFSHKLRVIQVAPVPTITGLDPAEGAHGQTLALTVTGTNLAGATALTFLQDGTPDPAFTVTDLQGNAEGTQLQASVAIAPGAALGPRTVTVTTPGGTSDATPSPATTFTVLGRLTLIPNFQTLKAGRTGDLAVALSTPAPPGGLTVTLTSANPAIATVGSPASIPAGATSTTTTVTAIAEGSTTLTGSAPDFADALAAVTVVTNRPPTLAPIGNRTAPLGQTLAFTVTGSDPDGDPVGFGVSPLPLPLHATFDRVTGQFTFTPAADQVGIFTLTFSVTDGSATASETITNTVPTPPPGNPTGVTGRVFNLNNTPLGNVTVTLKSTGQTTLTGADGFFTLTSIPSGRQVLLVNGREANLGTFAILAVPVSLIAGVLNHLASPITLPDVDVLAEVPVNPNATTVVTNPNVPGVQLTIPAGAARNADGTLYTGKLSINPVPDYGRPESRPEELRPGMAITLQPAGVRFNPPVPLTFPNADGMPAGSELNLWSLSPETGTFNLVGRGTVSSDGRQIVTVEGGVRASAWHFFLAPAGTTNTDVAERDGLVQDPQKQCRAPAGSTLALQSGCLSVEVALPAVRSLGVSRALTLVYQSHRADPQPLIPFNATIQFRAAVPPALSYSLSVGGVEQGTETFVNTSGLSENQDETIRGVVSFDATGLPTGIYPYRLKLTSNYLNSAISSFVPDRVLVVNDQQSPFGAGWGLGDLQRLHLQPDGSVLLTVGGGSTSLFEQDRPLVVESFGLDRSQVIGGVNNSLVAGGIFAQARNALLDLANFGPGGVVPRGVQPRSGLLTVTTENLTGVDVFVLNPISPELSDTEVGVLEQFVQEGGVLLEVRNVFSNRPLLLGTFPGPFVGDGTADLTPAGRDSPLAQGPFGVVGSPLATGANGAYATTGFATVIARNDLGPNVLLLQPGPGFSGTGRAVLIGDEEIFASGFVTGGSNHFAANRTFFLNTFAFAAGAPGFRPSSPVPGVAVVYQASQGDFSRLVRNTDGTFTRTLKDGTKIHFNAQGRQTAVVDRNGNTTTYAYDAVGRLSSITDPVGLITTFAYTGDRLRTVADPAGRVTTLTHDAEGNLVTVTFPDGATRTFGYDTRHRLITETDPRGFTTERTYSGVGRLQQVRAPDGATRTATSAQAVGFVDPAGGLGTPTAPAPVVRPAAAVNTVTDGRGQQQVVQTGRFGAPLRLTDALGRTTLIERNIHGDPLRLTRPSGSVVTMTYDARGNLLTTTEQAIGATTTFTYEATFNQVTALTDPRGNRTTLAYDARGNPTTITDALGQVTTLTYDPRGLLTSTTDALGNVTTFTYDTKGNLTSTTDPLGRGTSLTYDAAGNVVSSTDALGRVTTFAYDPLNRLIQVTDPTGALTRYTYDPKGNLVSVTDAKGQPTTFAYTAVDQLTQTVNPLGQSKTFTYDLARNLTLVVDAQGQRVEFTYDAANQLIQKVLKDATGTVTDTVTFTYDLLGNLATGTDTDSSLALTYDALGRLTRAQTGATIAQPASSIASTYDLAGNRLTMTDPGGGLTSSTYDALNRLTTLTSPQGTSTLTYDALSRRTSLTLPNGSRATYAYDAASQLTRLLNQGPGATPVTLADFAYTHDAVGNRSTRTTTNGIASYTYDAMNRLTQASQPDPIDPLRQVTEAFTYDPVGNRTASHLAAGQLHDAANRLLEDSTFTYTYDPNGNLAAKTSKATGAPTTYTYDADNRLTQVQTPTLTALYRYDSLGRRIAKEVTQGGTTTSTRYIYDNEDILLELDGANVVQARYTHGPGIDEPLIMLRGGASFFYHADALGSIWDLTDSAGTAARSYTYDSFGNILTQPGSLANPYTYTGREVDPETGLYYYRARYYDPATGRFLAVDPIIDPGILSLNPVLFSVPGLPSVNPVKHNVYTYVELNPVTFIDPFGLEACSALPQNCPGGMWSGSGFETGVQLGVLGVRRIGATLRCWGNPNLTADVDTTCGVVGGGLSADFSAVGIYCFGGQTKAQLSGISEGWAGGGGKGIFGSGGGVTGSKTGATCVSTSAGLGAGFFGGAISCETKVQ